MSFAYMALYTGDYLRDTRHLSMSEHGAYLLALMYCWDAQGAPMPLDERKQFAIVTARSGDEMEAWRRVRDEFFVRMDDGWYNRRLTSEVERMNALSAARAGAAKVRWSARSALKGMSDANAMQLHSTSNACEAPHPHPHPQYKEHHNVPSAPAEPQVLVDESLASTTLGENPKGKRLPNCPTQAIVDLYHQHCPALPRCAILTDQRKRAIASRWRQVADDVSKDHPDAVAEQTLDWFAWFFREQVGRSPFLMGRVKQWRASLDWLMRPANFPKVVEGFYARDTATQ